MPLIIIPLYYITLSVYNQGIYYKKSVIEHIDIKKKGAKARVRLMTNPPLRTKGGFKFCKNKKKREEKSAVAIFFIFWTAAVSNINLYFFNKTGFTSYSLKTPQKQHFEHYFRFYCRSAVIFAVIGTANFVDK